MPQICKRCLYTETHPLGIVLMTRAYVRAAASTRKRTGLTGITGGNFSVTLSSHIGRKSALLTTVSSR